jgi:hypothetical protein
MHQAPDEPKLDEAWVQYYGGEKLGGIKRLTSIDDDLPESNDSDSNHPPEKALTSGASDISESHNQPPPPSVQLSEAPATKDHEAPTENRTLGAIAPINEVRRQEKPRRADLTPGPRAIEAVTRQAPTIGQRDGSKDVNPSELNAANARIPSDTEIAVPSFESWSRRWAPWLKRGGSIKVCEAFFLMTYGQGKAECFTSNSEIMKRTELSRAQCIRNIHYLIEMGFLDELSEVNNREAKGTYYRFNLVPKSLAGQ